MIYSHLEKLGEPNRLLPHLHLPKSDGTMIEIDLVMIARTGIYVFESKNFSDRCTLKKMYVQSGPVKVMNRHLIVREIIKDMAELPDIFTPLEIKQIYSELAPYTLTAAAIGQARIETVRLE
jgi:hypothetical protein